MAPVVKTLSWTRLIALSLLLLSGPGTSWSKAEETDRDEKNRWVPSIAILSGAFTHRVQASTSTGDINCPYPPLDPSTCAILENRPNIENQIYGHDARIQPPPRDGRSPTSSQRTFTPYLAASLEIMTPSVIEAFGSPRGFAHVDFAYTFGFERDIALIGDPGPVTYPDKVTFPNPPEGILGGQGSATRFEVDSFQVSAGAGIAFTLKIADRTVRLKPSFEYTREALLISGEVIRQVKTFPGISQAGTAKYREIHLAGSQNKDFHAIGPGLEVEVDTRRAGPLVLSLFAGAQAYAILGDLALGFEDVNEFGERAAWTFQANRWFFRGNVGLRFRWIPE